MRDPRTYAIIGAAMEVHRQLGRRFLEAVYHDAMVIEMASRDIPFRHELALPIFYKGEQLSTVYRADFVCFDDIIVELKSQSRLSNIEGAQLINYLKATKFETGLLLNFGEESLQYKRFINSSQKSAPSA